jgi:hypothetical protein
MVLGMSLSAFTLLHVVISLIGIATGLVVAAAMLRSKAPNGWTALFLATTVLTSATGFLFPVDKILPSHIVGAISLVVLAVAIIALYSFRLAGSWRWIYVATALFALYLNCFVLVAQAFLKVAFLKALAPTQSDPPFIIAQVAVVAVFVLLGIKALRSFHPDADQAALRPV